jgi:hypothetical protein
MDTNLYYWRLLLKGIALREPVTKPQTGYWLAKQKVEENLAQQEKSVPQSRIYGSIPLSETSDIYYLNVKRK